ncbi:MAG: hypothetical protein JXB07_13410 [Anaerolineae bacterium]|nr:hypothetical protein [Anaerolineae bacterium]
MASQTVSVGLPKSVFMKLDRVAELTHRSVEDVLAATVDAVLVAPAGLPTDLANELAAMQVFSDEALWAAAQPSLSPAEQTRLSQLNHTAGERSLTAAEASEQEYLLVAYNSSVLRRAQALAILHQRGHSIQEQDIPSDSSGQ